MDVLEFTCSRLKGNWPWWLVIGEGMGRVLSEGSGVLKVCTRPRRLEDTLTALAIERSSPKDETDLSSSSFRRRRVEVVALMVTSSILGAFETGAMYALSIC
jgi:hypothetical protein